MKTACITVFSLILQLQSFSQNSNTSQWSYATPFTHQSFITPLIRGERSENYVVSFQKSIISGNFWYHSNSRMGLELGYTSMFYFTYDWVFNDWVEQSLNSDNVLHFGSADYSVQLNAFLTYNLGNTKTFSFHAFGGYARHLRKWRMPELLQAEESAWVNDYAIDDDSDGYRKLYHASAKQLGFMQFFRIGLNTVHNDPKSSTSFKCWFDLHPPIYLEYQIEEISANNGMNLNHKRKVGWFPAVGAGIEIHGWFQKKKK